MSASGQQADGGSEPSGGRTVLDIHYEVFLALQRPPANNLYLLTCPPLPPYVASLLNKTAMPIARESHLPGPNSSPLLHIFEPRECCEQPTANRSCFTSASMAIAQAAKLRHLEGYMMVLHPQMQAVDTLQWGAAAENAQRTAEPDTSQANRVFSDIYDRRKWGNSGEGSGIGSTEDYTAVARHILKKVVHHYNVRTMVDAPCGSFHWMTHALQKLPMVNYTGLDIVCNLIQKHRENPEYSRHSFYCLDMCHQDLPPNQDLIFSRDALQHLPHNFIYSFLHNVKRSRAKYLLVGSYVDERQNNRDITVGGYFPINLLAPPFSVRPLPMAIFPEVIDNAEQKHLLLFDVAKMEWAEP